MGLEYTNRRGTRYYVFQGETKTGKPKYFASRKPDSDKGVRIETLPDEFEIFEHPESTIVTIRKRKPTACFRKNAIWCIRRRLRNLRVQRC